VTVLPIAVQIIRLGAYVYIMLVK